MYQNDNDQLKVSINCREGPIKERTCTDCCCCLIYILLIAAIIFLSIFASSASEMTNAQIEANLAAQNSHNIMLAITKASKQILLGLACVIALCFILVFITFLIPQISVYIIIPLSLILMLLLGAGFLYRYFGKQLPFVNKSMQSKYVHSHSLMALVIGVAFLAAFVISVVVMCFKQQRFSYIVYCLKLAKLCFWDNCYMLLISFVMSAVTLGYLYINIWLIEISEVQAEEFTVINKNILTILICIEIVWTHGYLQAYSDFLFQSIALHWYYNEAKYQREGGYSAITKNLCASVGLSFRHIGTISFGFILAFIPESINNFLKVCQEKARSCYNCCCICHKCLFEHLSKYCYTATIMYSSPFCQASTEMRQIRSKAKHTFPELYMVGNFYITLAKIFVVMTGLIVTYFFMTVWNPHYFVKVYHLIAPLIIVFLGSLEISTHFMNATGMVGDTIYFGYVIDYNCESANFGNLNAAHCPREAQQIILEARNNRYDFND